MTDKKLNIILLGAPGAGKGTQAELLKKEYSLLHISTGDMLREEVKSGSELGQKVSGCMERGELVSDEIVTRVVVERMGRDDAASGVLLDGFPRTCPQAESLDSALTEKGNNVDAVLYLTVDEDVVITRLTGRRLCRACGKIYHMTNMPPAKEGVCDECGGEIYQRDDDTLETVTNRLKVYEENTKDLIQFYKDKGVLKEVVGNTTPEDLFEAIKVLFKAEGLSQMTILTDLSEIEKIRNSGKIIREIFSELEGFLKAGMSTKEIDEKVEMMILESGAEPAFKGYRGFPATICASMDNVVVHGIPGADIILKEGSIISIDVGVKKNGYFTDAARTFALGGIGSEAEKLIEVTKRSLAAGISKAVEGNNLGDISHAVQKTVKEGGFQEVRSFVGHGIGVKLHEPPEVPNWGERGKGPVLKEGLVLAIEPMVNAGTREVEVLEDGWTAVTKDGKLSAHFEHTVIVGKDKAEAIT